jgi:hypothetical protein
MTPVPSNFLPPRSAGAKLLRLQLPLLAFALAASLAAASAPALPSPETRPEPPIRTHFENGDPINDLFTALSVRFGILVIQPQDIKAFILQDFDLPAKAQDAIARTRQTLEPQGYSILQSVTGKNLVIRVVTTAQAKKARLTESPVSFGPQAENVDISDPARLLTHMMPLNHPGLAEALRRAASEDKDVSVEIAGGNQLGTCLLLLGPALKVQQAVEKVSKIDRFEEGPSVVRILTLKNLDAPALAISLNQSFARENSPVKAAADARTNSLILSGPENRVLDVMVPIVSQEARAAGGIGQPPPPRLPPPATAPLPGSPPEPATAPGAFAPRSQTLDEIAHLGENITVCWLPRPAAGSLRAWRGFLLNLDAI